MKKFFTVLTLTIILPVFALIVPDSAQAKENGVSNCFKKTFTQVKKSDKQQIRELVNNLNKYSNEHNKEAIKEYYSKDYMSYDGFDYDAFFASIDETFETYPDISYKSTIKTINLYNDYATVHLVDTSTSKRQTITQSIKNNRPVINNVIEGIMESKCNYVIYLKKVKNRWLIYSDSIISEETTIKYGSARDLDMDVYSPLVVKEGEDYCIGLNIQNKPKNAIVLASLTREEIKYPPAKPDDIFRKVPQDGTLERVVKSNKKGTNEYSLASVGITEISLNDERTAINYEMSGIAFLMKRVNVYAQKNAVDRKYLNKMQNKEQEKNL